MNVLFIITIIILLLGALRGFRRGFLRVVFSLIAVLVLIVLVSWLNPHIKDVIRTHTSLYEKVENYAQGVIENKIGDMLPGTGITQSVILQEEESTSDAEVYRMQSNGSPYVEPVYMERIAGSQIEAAPYMTQTVGMDADTIRKYAESRGIDEETIRKYAAARGMTEEEAIREYAREHGVDEDQAVRAYEKAYGSGGSGASGESENSSGINLPLNGLLPSILQNYLLGSGDGISSISERMADIIIGGASFVLAMIIGLIIIAIIERLLDAVNKIPVAGGINRIFGIFAGLFEGLVIIWIIMLVISLTAGTQFGETALAMVQENPFLSFLYQFNGLTYIWSLFFGK